MMKNGMAVLPFTQTQVVFLPNNSDSYGLPFNFEILISTVSFGP